MSPPGSGRSGKAGSSKDQPASAAATTQARWIASLVGGAFLLLIIGFVAMVFFVQDEVRLNAVGPIAAGPGAERGGLVFQGTANIWEVRGRMTSDTARNVRFAFDLVGPTGQPAPASLDLSLRVYMPDREADARTLPLARTGIGSYVATASSLEPGRWRLRMTFPEIDGVFHFDVDE